MEPTETTDATAVIKCPEGCQAGRIVRWDPKARRMKTVGKCDACKGMGRVPLTIAVYEIVGWRQVGAEPVIVPAPPARRPAWLCIVIGAGALILAALFLSAVAVIVTRVRGWIQ